MTERPTSARQRLFGRVHKDRRHGDEAQLCLELDGIEARAGLRPVGGGELEIASARPVGHDANHLSEVALGIDTVELAAGDEGIEIGGGLSVIVGAEEEPCLPARSDDSERIFAVVVLHMRRLLPSLRIRVGGSVSRIHSTRGQEKTSSFSIVNSRGETTARTY